LLGFDVVLPLSIGGVVLVGKSFYFLSQFLVHGRRGVGVQGYEYFVKVHEEIHVLEALFVGGSFYDLVPDLFVKPTQFK
jgi:hypothetical protein